MQRVRAECTPVAFAPVPKVPSKRDDGTPYTDEERLDMLDKRARPVGPLHGIPVIGFVNAGADDLAATAPAESRRAGRS